MSERPLQRSFAGGEITPELAARMDLTKFQTGLALCKNFEILPYGPARNRAGFEFINQTKYGTSTDRTETLLPFAYTTAQSIVLEVGHGYIRFHTLGATVLETAHNITGITQAATGVLTHDGSYTVTNGQWFYLTATGMTEVHHRFVIAANVSGATFELHDLFGNAIDTSGYGAFSAGTLARVYEITTPYADTDVFDLHYTQDGLTLTLTHPSYPVYELTMTSLNNWTLAAPTWEPEQVAPTNLSATPGGAGGSAAYYYTVTAISSWDSGEESFATSSCSCNNDLSIQGNYNTIHWDNAANAIRYNIYKASNGLYGFIGQSDDGTSGFIDDNITADISMTPPEDYNPFTGAGYYPVACAHFEGRRWFAGSIQKPNNVWATRSGTETNMSYSMPSRDDDSMSFRMKSNQMGYVRHMVPLAEMVVLTTGGEWKLVAQNSDVLTPTTIGYKPQSYVGASNATPVLADSAVLYAQDRGGHIRELSYSWESNGYKSGDVSIMAPHLFDYRYTIKQLAFLRQPLPCLWAVRDDGALLGMTYVPEHQVFAWHQHDTAGEFTSCCAASEDITGLDE